MSWLSELLGGERRKTAQRSQLVAQRGLQQLQASQDAMMANALGQYDALETTGLEGLGQSARGRIADAYTMEQSRSLQSLIDRGLGNSTVVDAMRRGLIADETKQYQSLDEQLRRERMNLSLGKLGFIERSRIPPTSLFQMSSQLGAATALPPTPLESLGQGLFGGLGLLGGAFLGRRV